MVITLLLFFKLPLKESILNWKETIHVTSQLVKNCLSVWRSQNDCPHAHPWQNTHHIQASCNMLCIWCLSVHTSLLCQRFVLLPPDDRCRDRLRKIKSRVKGAKLEFKPESIELRSRIWAAMLRCWQSCVRKLCCDVSQRCVGANEENDEHCPSLSCVSLCHQIESNQRGSAYC